MKLQAERMLATERLHREVAAAFFEALPSQPIRWTQRLFWRSVLALAATSAGRWLLRTLRGG